MAGGSCDDATEQSSSSSRLTSTPNADSVRLHSANWRSTVAVRQVLRSERRPGPGMADRTKTTVSAGSRVRLTERARRFPSIVRLSQTERRGPSAIRRAVSVLGAALDRSRKLSHTAVRGRR